MAPNIVDQATVLNAKEAAELLGIHHTTLYEAAKRGEIPCRRVGRRFIFIREAIVQWMTRDTTQS